MADVAMWCVEYPTMTRPAGGRHRAHLVDSSRTASADDDGLTAAAMAAVQRRAQMQLSRTDSSRRRSCESQPPPVTEQTLSTSSDTACNRRTATFGTEQTESLALTRRPWRPSPSAAVRRVTDGQTDSNMRHRTDPHRWRAAVGAPGSPWPQCVRVRHELFRRSTAADHVVRRVTKTTRTSLVVTCHFTSRHTMTPDRPVFRTS